jgi:hypothetical protein
LRIAVSKAMRPNAVAGLMAGLLTGVFVSRQPLRRGFALAATNS